MARRDDGKGLPALWQEAVNDGEDPLRGLPEHMLQSLLQKEMTAFLGAEPHQRTDERRGYRNGHHPHTLTTRVGRLDEEGEEMLGVYALPAEHRKRMRSTNMLERSFEEVRRRTRVVGSFRTAPRACG